MIGLPLIAVILFTLVALVAAPFLMFIVMRRQIKNLPSGASGHFGEHTLTISPQGFREETAVNDSFGSWAGVKDIVHNENYIFIFTETHMAHVIPKRAFVSSEEAQSFYDTAHGFWKEAIVA